MMNEEQKPAPIVVTAAWRKEQQAKRDAYEAKRRAWVRTFERGTGAGEEDSPAQGETSPPNAIETGSAGVVPRRGRRRGMIQDKRQARFTF
jgi:hypothetical protein